MTNNGNSWPTSLKKEVWIGTFPQPPSMLFLWEPTEVWDGSNVQAPKKRNSHWNVWKKWTCFSIATGQSISSVAARNNAPFELAHWLKAPPSFLWTNPLKE